MINSKTKLIGLLGHPVAHSKSPIMHNSMFQALKLNYAYLAFDVEPKQLEEAVTAVKALHIRGLNVTIPHKVEIMPFLDEISEEARIIGAVNTVVNENGKLLGYNTDGEGYVRSLLEETGTTLIGKKVLVLGAGGAARAINYSLSKQPIRQLVIVNRDKEKADQMKNELKKQVEVGVAGYEELEEEIRKTDVIINTTSIGMFPHSHQSLIEKEWIEPRHLVSDIIYNPLATQLLQDAKEQGAVVHSGLGMFVYQGVLAFEKWTGITPDPNVMRESVLESFRKEDLDANR